MSIASDIKSTFLNITKNESNEGSIPKNLSQIAHNFKSTPTIIAKDLKIEGNIVGTGSLEIEGNIRGIIHGNSVILREEGVIEGEVIADSLNIRGRFNGNVRAKNVSISSRAKITGIIEYGTLSVEDGAYIDGQFKQLEKISS